MKVRGAAGVDSFRRANDVQGAMHCNSVAWEWEQVGWPVGNPRGGVHRQGARVGEAQTQYVQAVKEQV